MPNFLSHSSYFTALLLALLLTACAPTPERPDTQPDVEPTIYSQKELEARAAASEGHYYHAIALYQQLALENEPPQQQDYRLLAIETMIAAGETVLAQEQLEILAYAPLSPEQALKRQLITAELVLAQDPDRALELLAQPAAPEHEIEQFALLAGYHHLRAQAFTLVGNHLESAREHILREFYLTDANEIADNQQAIWQALTSLSSTALQQFLTNPPPDLLSGWIELALIMRDDELNIRQSREKLDRWHADYPQHPLLPQLEGQWLATKIEFTQRPEQIALLLPFSGRYAKVAEAVRDGVLAASYRDTEEHPTLHLYDTGGQTENITALYDQAVAEGAEFVIGPLDKQAVALLTRRLELPVPTLALNQFELTAPSRLYQFSLSPEGEAKEVAQRAWQDGLGSAAILVPDSSLGRRVSESFTADWEELGGTVASVAFYDQKKNDFSAPITQMLSVDASKLRKRRISNLLGERLEYTPRRRQDIDFIFLLAHPLQARLIRPQLKFHHATRLPIYATSHIYSGSADRQKDRDLDDIQFVDMLWILAPEKRVQHLGQTDIQFLDKHAGALQRLVAFGIDAYQLVYQIRRLENYPTETFSGVTGELSLGENNRLLRKLELAKVKGGRPQLLARTQPSETEEQ